jgi:hypothetical protein
MTATWRNRIVGYSEEAPDQLLANPKNWRSHPATQADALRGVLNGVGVVQNVLANKRTGYLIDGHLRVMEALKSGQSSIPVTWVDLDEAEEATILATLDPLAALAGTDAAQLEALLHEVSTDSPALAAMLDALAQRAGIVEGEPVDPADLWKGMPEFEQEDLEAHKTIKIHFANEDDYQAFARLVGQTLTPNTRSIWYPEQNEPSRIVNECADDAA